MIITRRIATVTSIAALIIGAMVGPAVAATSAPADPSCRLAASGKESFAGVLGLQERWTETFSDNNCDRPVRAQVFCNDEGTTGSETHYGRTIDGNGTSYYTCDITQNLAGGNAQVYTNGKWVTYAN